MHVNATIEKLPQATAVNMPAITANAQPAVITIHPEFSALERFNKTPATTPSPSSTNTSVPRNSPSKGDRIEFPFARETYGGLTIANLWGSYQSAIMPVHLGRRTCGL